MNTLYYETRGIKMNDEELAKKAAQHIVESWERIPKIVDSFCYNFGERYRKMHTDMLQEMCGGEDMYKASKEYLQHHPS